MAGEKILIVEDDGVIALQLKSSLLRFGYSIPTMVISGERALEQARVHRPDLVLMDIRLAGEMDGIDAAARIRSELNIPIVFLTALNDDLVQKAKITEPYAYLLKPVDDKSLHATIEVALYRHALDIKLRASERRFRAIFDQAPLGIALIDSHTGRFLQINSRYCEIAERSREEILGHHYQSITHPDDLQENLANVKTLVDGETSFFKMEKRYIRPGGGVVWVSLTAVPMWEGNEAPSFHMVMVEDITGRKCAEEERKKLEAQLRYARKMEAVGTLAGGIAHDFNNILATILGYAEMALDGTPEDLPARHDMEEVFKAAHRAKELVGQVLILSPGRDMLARRPMEIGPPVKDALRLVDSALHDSIELRRNISGVTGSILGDPAQIRQVVLNLCTNAAHAMQEKGGVLEVDLATIRLDTAIPAYHGEVSPGHYLRLSVRDTGHGMDSAILERIFDPYFTTKPVGEGGGGLGLAVVEGIVRRHGGAIIIESEPGLGTVFHVFFPEIDVEHRNENGSTKLVSRGTECILLVDDDEMMAQLGRRMLCQLGYQVTVKTNGKEAVELFSTHPDIFDLVMIDQTVLLITGMQLAEELLRIRPDIPIILCTEDRGTEDSDGTPEEDLRKTGIRAIAQKPFSRKNLAEVVQRIFASVEV